MGTHGFSENTQPRRHEHGQANGLAKHGRTHHGSVLFPPRRVRGRTPDSPAFRPPRGGCPAPWRSRWKSRIVVRNRCSPKALPSTSPSLLTRPLRNGGGYSPMTGEDVPDHPVRCKTFSHRTANRFCVLEALKVNARTAAARAVWPGSGNPGRAGVRPAQVPRGCRRSPWGAGREPACHGRRSSARRSRSHGRPWPSAGHGRR